MIHYGVRHLASDSKRLTVMSYKLPTIPLTHLVTVKTKTNQRNQRIKRGLMVILLTLVSLSFYSILAGLPF